MWKHYCKAERTWLFVENGCECNWCGVMQSKSDGMITSQNCRYLNHSYSR